MAASGMLKVFQKYNFLSATKEDEDAFGDDIRREKEIIKNPTVDDVKTLIRGLQQKTAVPNFPKRHVPGAWMASIALQSVFGIIRNVDNPDPETLFYEEWYQYFMAMYKSGPSTMQSEMMPEIASKAKLSKYTQTFTGDKLIKHIGDLKQEFYIKGKGDDDTPLSEYCTIVDNGVGAAMTTCTSEEMYIASRVAALDVFYYFLVKLQACTEQSIASMITYAMCYIERPLMPNRGDMYEGLNDAALLRSHMKIVLSCICDKDFPRFSNVASETQPLLGRILGRTKSDADVALALLPDMMSALHTLAQHEVEKNRSDVARDIGRAFEYFDKKALQNKFEIFQETGKSFVSLCVNAKHAGAFHKAVRPLFEKILVPTSGKSPKALKLWSEIFVSCLANCHYEDFSRAPYYVIRENIQNFKWQNDKDAAKAVMKGFAELKAPGIEFRRKWTKKEGKPPEGQDQEKITSNLADFADQFFDTLKRSKLLNEMMDDLVSFLLFCLKSKSPMFLSIADKGYCYTDFKKHNHLIPQVVDTLLAIVDDEEFPWFDYWTGQPAPNIMQTAMDGVKDGKQFPCRESMLKLSNIVMTKELINEERNSPSNYGSLYMGAVTKFVELQQAGDMDYVEPIIDGIMNLVESEIDGINHIPEHQLYLLGTKEPKLLGPYMERILDQYFSTGNNNMLQCIQQAYEFNPEPLTQRFQEFYDDLDGKDQAGKMYGVSLLVKVAKSHPEVFTREIVDNMFEEYIDDQSHQMNILTLCASLSEKHPDLVLHKMDDMHKLMKTAPYMSYNVKNIFMNIAVKRKQYIETILNYFLSELSPTTDQTMIFGLLDGIKGICALDKPLVSKHKAKFEDVRDKTNNASAKDLCQHIVDIIEGRSLATLSTDVKNVQDDVDQLDTRVTNTEENVVTIQNEVNEQKQDIEDIKEDVTKVEERVDNVENVVQETVEKVEEIDHKTMTNAPAWSRDVTVLLNPEADHDWRLLASRLGYTPEDIRGWATQSDPCMAVLSEWYATHKTREATFAVLQTLKEMNRLDAAAVVEEALKSVQDVVDDEPPEYETPPPIFLSYQWGHQAEAKLIRKHLEMAGYDCWMDVGQMGGGDKLFAKIDTGIRAAKVVVCCVTDKYAQSPNCNREVNLAVSLGKPIIPLLIEKMSWPPPGSMGPIFSEYLFIRFFARNGEEMSADGVWAKDKFQELLMQLNYNKIMPEEDKIKGAYMNWWEPPEEVIVVSKREEKSTTAVTSSVEKGDDQPSPEVFISYQWGKQKQIKLLYKRLSGLGYNCWMDIYQMGGGDSLYDKIDRGIRGCKVVVSIVTPKYAMSANCRREVSLCDALKKPVVPLLLEDMTWPPSGPMSMVFTQLLYIDFHSTPGIQESWRCDEFDQLISKIRQHIPDPLTIEERKSSPDISPKEDATPTKVATPLPGPNPVTEKQTDGETCESPTPPQVTNTEPAEDVAVPPDERVPRKEPTQGRPPSAKSTRSNNNEPLRDVPNDTPKKSKSCSIL